MCKAELQRFFGDIANDPVLKTEAISLAEGRGIRGVVKFANAIGYEFSTFDLEDAKSREDARILKSRNVELPKVEPEILEPVSLNSYREDFRQQSTLETLMVGALLFRLYRETAQAAA